MTTTPNAEIELAFVNTFIVRAKRERYAMFVKSGRRRRTFLDALYHFGDFDPRFLVPVTGGIDSRGSLLADLRRRGAGNNCHIISAHRDLDGATLSLEEAVDDIYVLKEATVIVCNPIRLAYYEGEGFRSRFILDSQAQESRRDLRLR
jgi:hypothetical protein